MAGGRQGCVRGVLTERRPGRWRAGATVTRTASTPADPNAVNDTGSATCTVLSVLLVRC